MMWLLRKHIRVIRFAFIAAAVAVGVVACGGGGGGSSGGDGMQITPAPGGGSPTPPPSISIGESQNGNLAREMDPWLVNLTAGTTYRFDMESGDFNARLAIYNNDSTPRQLAADDDGGDGTNARLVYRANYTGIHSLRASAVGNASGVYRLSTGTVVIVIQPPSPPVVVAPPTPPAAPDLIVETPGTDVTTLAADTSFTLRTTVRNAGNGAAAATTLRYYLSTNSTISTSDTAVGSDSVSALASGRSALESIGLRTPSSSGNYYYGVCVDSVADESNTANNCSSTVQVVVTPVPTPDLRVESPAVDVATITTGGTFTWSAIVRNAGSGAAAATTLQYYRSTNSTISVSDTSVGTDSVLALTAGGFSEASIALNAPSNAGNYYYGACVVSVAGESNIGNNCSVGVLVTVYAPPDLVVESPGVDDATVTPGGYFTLRATVRNAGNGAAAATTLRYYRSPDSTIDTADIFRDFDSVAALSAGGSGLESITLRAPFSTGVYYYGACVSSVAGEINTGNNCSSGVRVTVSVLPSDLVVESPGAPATVTAENRFTLRATVRNAGSGAAAATTLRYYRSTDSTISTTDGAVGTDSVSALSAGGSSLESTSVFVSSGAGTYYYGACVDSVAGESNTGNNCSSGVRVVVTPVPPSPDLVVESPGVDDATVVQNGPFTLRATVRNAGTGAAAATILRYYLSVDSRISTSDIRVGTDSVSTLAAGGSSEKSIDLNAPSSIGGYYYGACVDSVSDESNTGNNCSSGVPVTVFRGRPDLVVESPGVDDATVTPGGYFTLRATVRNAGTVANFATYLWYYRSPDSTIDSGDTFVGSDSVAALSPGVSGLETISLRAPFSTGVYYYGACILGTNNCSSGVRVTVR